ncbi:hypothetical protein, variant 1 [Verruconis gallopava]|uniref:SnoaL-like domain-containing protein n=1 Tax=Verruconis gallopava TaxID=253628 RepID=A0A0D1Y2P4_9PEZI|nr:hypothetical protein, variant 1 [Verruconis gallopava]KIW09321.1 hypothetical protein, variant 1 [Verruconis gallopava]
MDRLTTIISRGLGSLLRVFSDGFTGIISIPHSLLTFARSKKNMADVQEASGKAESKPALPDFYTDPNAVLNDDSSIWRFGKKPDYTKTRKVYEETKRCNHAAGSLPDLVENLVKNWEIEASFKTRLEDWRTINQERYSFSMNGKQRSSVDYMLKQGTYNAILPPSEYYSPEHNDFSVSHKTFKRMMPTFAWEVLEVYSGPPKVAFRWRHWGWMKNDYIAFNCNGEKVMAKAHDGIIDIEGVTVADLDGDMKIVHLETWFDPMSMFSQVAPNGVTKASQPESHSSAELGPEEDSVKRESATNASVVSNEIRPNMDRRSVSSAAADMPHGEMSSEGEGCPFARSS